MSVVIGDAKLEPELIWTLICTDHEFFNINKNLYKKQTFCHFLPQLLVPAQVMN